MQAHVKTEYAAIIFSYYSLTSRSPAGNHSLALQSCSAVEKINFISMNLCKKKKSLGEWSPTGVFGSSRNLCVF